jgi:16S rRNA C967 or C1407 C5-methylase (RsmB/RsmF family)/NOL1/NOP2/fmu family ribosome biogenesis protein
MNWPIEFIQNLKLKFGDDYAEILDSLEKKQFPSIRFNQKKRFKHAFGNLNVKWENESRQLQTEYSFVFDPFWHAGAYYVQESSSMFLGFIFEQLFREKQPQTVLDLCAAPGGKSTQLLSKMDENGILVSNEILPKRNAILRENIQKWAYPNVVITQNKPIDFQKIGNFFDFILVDAPCSGEGLFRKNNKAISEWSTENVNICSNRQRQILEDVLPSLKNGGYLVYSTCTFEKSENEDIIDFAINELDLFSVEIDISAFPNITKTRTKDGIGYYFLPNKVDGSGLFMAVLQKKGLPFEPKQQASSKSNTSFSEWLKTDDSINIIEKNDRFFLFPLAFTPQILQLSQALYVTYLGIEIGQLKGKELIPSHQLALSNHIKDDFQYISVDKENALKYLKRLHFEPQESPDYLGWALVKYENINLGWVKLIQGRINNYFPLNWRIIKDLEF